MKQMTSGGLSIAYHDEGSGPPIILAHCSSASHRMWQALIDALAPRHRVLAPDLIGYGASESWPPHRTFQVGADAQILVDLASKASEPVHLVGHSYGGVAALEAAQHLQGAVRAMTLIEPVAFPLLAPAGRQQEWRQVQRLIAEVQAAMDRGDREKAAALYMQFWIGRLGWWFAPRKFKTNVLETIEKVALEFRSANQPPASSQESLSELAMPTLLIYGAKTRRPAKAVIEILEDWLPDAQTERIAGAGHMSPITHGDAVNTLILAHIAAHADRGRSANTYASRRKDSATA